MLPFFDPDHDYVKEEIILKRDLDELIKIRDEFNNAIKVKESMIDVIHNIQTIKQFLRDSQLQQLHPTLNRENPPHD